MTEKDKNHNRHDVSQTPTTARPREQLQRQQQSVVRIAAAIAVPALAALVIVFVIGVGSNTQQAFAPPPPPCPACGTVINGTGEGTITIPENKKTEIPPEPCPNCDATISFEASEDDLKATSGTVTITYDQNGTEQVIQGDVDRIKVTNDGSQFVLRGDLFIPGWDPSQADYILQGQTDQETGVTTLQLKAEGGVTGTFESQDIQVTIIGPD
jgi:hypothetical protein